MTYDFEYWYSVSLMLKFWLKPFCLSSFQEFYYYIIYLASDKYKSNKLAKYKKKLKNNKLGHASWSRTPKKVEALHIFGSFYLQTLAELIIFCV